MFYRYTTLFFIIIFTPHVVLPMQYRKKKNILLKFRGIANMNPVFSLHSI